MSRVILGNHSSVIVPRQDRDSIRKFYCDVLGGTITKAEDERDPTVWDLAGRMLSSRKSVYREVTNAEHRRWTWSFKLRGGAIDVAKRVSLHELLMDGIMGLPAQTAAQEKQNELNERAGDLDPSDRARPYHRVSRKQGKVQA